MAQPPEVVDARAMPADLVAVGDLARRRLAAQRRGVRLSVLGASPQLRALLVLVGLDAVLLGPEAGEQGSVEVVGQPEGGEELGAEEVRDARDPALAHAEDVDRPRLPPGAVGGGLVLREGR